MASLFAFILLFGIGFGIFGEKRVEASNAYTSNISFYKDAGGVSRIKFFVNTSFDITIGAETAPNLDSVACMVGGDEFANVYTPNGVANIAVPDDETLKFTCNRTFHYIAGNTYDHIAMYAGAYIRIHNTTKKLCVLNNCPQQGDEDLESKIGPLTSSTYFIHKDGGHWPDTGDTEKYYFSETPTLNITFPFENAEIAEAFYITGSYSIPENSGFKALIAFFYPTGLSYPTNSYRQDLIDLTGSINIRVSGIPTANYKIEFWFVGVGIEAYHATSQDINISIVSRIAPELPETQETPPTYFGVVKGDEFYPIHSNYLTPTNLYSNLINAVQPVIIVVGDNLTFFSSRFDQDTAKETGEKTGQAILMLRSYSSNLNTFFNDLPISEFLFFYLTLLIVVIVFRIIKNLINLIKP